jgi:hypothetical protein
VRYLNINFLPTSVKTLTTVILQKLAETRFRELAAGFRKLPMSLELVYTIIKLVLVTRL